MAQAKLVIAAFGLLTDIFDERLLRRFVLQPAAVRCALRAIKVAFKLEMQSLIDAFVFMSRLHADRVSEPHTAQTQRSEAFA